MIDILIVEDEQAIANLIHMNLTAEGYRCTTAYDGKQGADLIEQNNYDLILLDIMLPEITGYELLEYVRPMGTPVILSRLEVLFPIASGVSKSVRMTIS